MKCKSLRVCMLAMLVLLTAVLPVCASVTTGSLGERKPDTVYVAGNNNFYPVEYYDSEKKRFDGVLPEVLRRVSEETGINFVYIDGKRKTAQMAESGKVQMVSAYVQDGKNSFAKESITVFSYTQQGKTVHVGFAFTKTAGAGEIKKIKQALSGLSQEEINGYLVSDKFTRPNHKRVTVILGTLCVIALILVAFFLLRQEANRAKKIVAETKRTDEETGIGNLAYFEHHFHNTIPPSSRTMYYIAYIIADGSCLQMYYGESTFAEAMKYAAGVLLPYATPGNFVARITESGFAFAFRSKNREEAEQEMERIMEKLNVSVEGNKKEMLPMYHAAMYNLRAEDENTELLIINLRGSCSKIVGTNTVMTYCDESLISKQAEEQKLIEGFSRGFENQEFKLYLQFIADNKTKEITSAEALSRWEHPEEGLLLPGKFIGAMESTGTISRLDYYMFDAVCRQLHKWHRTEFGDISISCNFTRLTLSEDGFREKIRSISEGYIFDRNKLVIEITEDVMEKNRTTAQNNLTACKKMGFRVALDDMGSGYTALSNLCDYPIDIVKIDRDILLKTNTENGKQLFYGMIALAQNLQKQVVCEGVETEEQNAFVSASTCDFVQGWYYSKVHPATVCEDFVRTYRGNLKEKQEEVKM